MNNKFPIAICRICGNPIYHGDGKEVNKKGEWACTSCLIESDKEKC